ncbi:unnamed protein product [Closterium sp. Yama58-4]|nr:unnamed protein product [Closterium sp. Yama58-4]
MLYARPLPTPLLVCCSCLASHRLPPPPSFLADLVSNTAAPILPFALGAASVSQASGIVELSILPAHDDCPDDATPPPISLPVLTTDHVLVSDICLHTSCHAADADPASGTRFPRSHPVLGTDLANSARLPTSLHDVCADPMCVARFPALLRVADTDLASASRLPVFRHGADTNLANATRLHAFLHGAGADPASVARFLALRDAADADPASATRLPASRHNTSTDPVSATRLPASRCDTSTDPANATCLPASRHDADVAQANATRLPACRHDAGADLARADRFPVLRHAAGADLVSAAHHRPAPRHAPAVQKCALPYAHFVRCPFRPSLLCLLLPPRLPSQGLPPLLPPACRAARLRRPPGLSHRPQPCRRARIPARCPPLRPLLLRRR